MVIRNYKYSPEDVDCRYCTESEDGCCKLHSCPWLTVHKANYEELRDLEEREKRKEKEHGRE